MNHQNPKCGTLLTVAWITLLAAVLAAGQQSGYDPGSRLHYGAGTNLPSSKETPVATEGPRHLTLEQALGPAWATQCRSS